MLLNPRQLPWASRAGRAWPYGVQVVLAVSVKFVGLSGAVLTGWAHWKASVAVCLLAWAWYLVVERRFVEALRRQRTDLARCRAAHEWCVLLGLALGAGCVLLLIVICVGDVTGVRRAPRCCW